MIPTVAGLAFKGDMVLLVKHTEKAGHITGVYGLPGGRLEENEEILEGAAREFQEETGLIPDKSSMVQIPTVYQADIPRKNGEVMHTSWYVFVVKEFSGEINNVPETIPEWVALGDVENFELLPNTEKAIKDGLKLL